MSQQHSLVLSVPSHLVHIQQAVCTLLDLNYHLRALLLRVPVTEVLQRILIAVEADGDPREQKVVIKRIIGLIALDQQPLEEGLVHQARKINCTDLRTAPVRYLCYWVRCARFLDKLGQQAC